MRITIEQIKKRRDIAEILFSNGEQIHLPYLVYKATGLRSHVSFEWEAFHRAVDKLYDPLCRERAGLLLGFKGRSVQEMRSRLLQAGYPEEVVARTMDFLLEEKLLDDREYAQLIAGSRTRSGLGSGRIRQELRHRGVDEELVDAALSQRDEDDLDLGLQKAADKAVRGRDLTDPMERKKAMAYLQRRGFSYQEARDAIVQRL